MLVNSRDLSLLGEAESLMLSVPEHQCLLQAEAISAFQQLRADAAKAGFDLRIASGFRNFSRQLAIWNGKVDGTRPIFDEQGKQLNPAQLPDWKLVSSILRFSALPGASRHHWGTDMDVYDAAAMPDDYQLQLTMAETQPGGLFAPLHRWLDERIATDQSYGLFRPYVRDLGGVAPEPWHLSFAPLSQAYLSLWNPYSLYQHLRHESIGCKSFLLINLPHIVQRYVYTISPPAWELGHD